MRIKRGNKLFEVSLGKIEKGEKFTRVYFTPSFPNGKPVGYFEVTAKVGDKEFKKSADKLGQRFSGPILAEDDDREVFVFDDFDIRQSIFLTFTYQVFGVKENEPVVARIQ